MCNYVIWAAPPVLGGSLAFSLQRLNIHTQHALGKYYTHILKCMMHNTSCQYMHCSLQMQCLKDWVCSVLPSLWIFHALFPQNFSWVKNLFYVEMLSIKDPSSHPGQTPPPIVTFYSAFAEDIGSLAKVCKNHQNRCGTNDIQRILYFFLLSAGKS